MKQSISSHEASEFAPSLLHHLPVSRRSQVLRQVLQHQLPPWHCKAWWSSIVWLGLAVGYEYADHVKSKSVDQNKALHHDSSWWFNMIQQKMMKPFLQALPTCSSLPRCVVARDLWWQWPDATVAECTQTHKHPRTHTHTLSHTHPLRILRLQVQSNCKTQTASPCKVHKYASSYAENKPTSLRFASSTVVEICDTS